MDNALTPQEIPLRPINGGAPGSPLSPTAELSDMDGRRRDDETFAESITAVDFLVTILDEDIVYARKHPLLGSLKPGALFPMRKPEDFLRGPIFHPGTLPKTIDGARARIWTPCYRPCMRQRLPLRSNMHFACWGRTIKWSAPYLDERPKSGPPRNVSSTFQSDAVGALAPAWASMQMARSRRLRLRLLLGRPRREL